MDYWCILENSMTFFKDWLRDGIIPTWSWRFGGKKVKKDLPTWCLGIDPLTGEIGGEDKGHGWIPAKRGPKDPPDSLPGPMA